MQIRLLLFLILDQLPYALLVTRDFFAFASYVI